MQLEMVKELEKLYERILLTEKEKIGIKVDEIDVS